MKNRPRRTAGRHVTGPVETLEPRLLMAVFTVINNADSGVGSLRWAIDQANHVEGQDTINFNIAGPDRVIRVKSELYGIYDSAIIDGTTQPGYSDRPLVQIDGWGAPKNPDNSDPIGLKLFGDSTVKGLSITGFLGDAIETLKRPDRNFAGNIIQRCWLGVGIDGKASGNRAMGVGLYTPGNMIGGPTREDGNVISASREGQGIYNWGSMNGYNTVQNNFIGTDPTGTIAYPNAHNGVFFNDSPYNRVVDNVISGNNDDGIFLNLDECVRNVVQGNIVGLTADGSRALPNRLYGIEIQGQNNLIGGDLRSQRNVFSGNGMAGVVFYGSYANNNQVRGNFIGTDVTGTKDVGNTWQGVAFSGGVDNLIRGNVISGNNAEGIGIFPGWGTVVQANIIGADVNYNPLPNGTWGITVINGSKDTSIGGGKGAGNFIAFNPKEGVYIQAPNTAVINNVITNNGADGVMVAGHDRNRVEANSIYANGGLGINLAWNGVSYNDAGDGDDGPNHAQNFPVIATAASDAATTTVSGSLNSVAGKTYRVYVYASPAADPTGYGEGKTCLGYVDVTTDRGGDANFSATFASATADGYVLTATATDPDGNTSEFSAAKVVSGQPVGAGGGGGGGGSDVTAPTVTSAALEDDRRPNSLRVAFSENVAGSLTLSDIVVTNLTTGQVITPRSVTYDPETNTARFWYKAVLPDGVYRATLSGGGITDATGNLLATYNLNFVHLAGDANHDRTVDKSDRAIFRTNYGRKKMSFGQGDFNYDGRVNDADAAILAGNWYKVLAAPRGWSQTSVKAAKVWEG